jgi:hypothetical protein
MWCHHALMSIEQCSFRFWHLDTLDCAVHNLKRALWWGGGSRSYHLGCGDSNFSRCFNWPDLKIKKCYSFCLMVEASDRGYVLHTRRIRHTVQNITNTHNIVLHNSQRYNLQKPSFVSYQGCVVHRWVFGVPWYTSLLEWKYAIQFSNK